MTNFYGFKLELGEIALLTFNQPRVNILSTGVVKDLVQALKGMHSSKDVKVLMITGEGSTFLAGANIKEMCNFSIEEAKRLATLFYEATKLIEDLPLPVIAAVNGFALGGGCELTLACDLVIASDTAVFGQPEINLGIIPGGGGTQRLSNRIGRLRAKELIFTGRRVSANEALSMGLVNKVVSKDRFFEEVIAIAKDIASRPLHCLEAAKRLINSGSLDKEIDEFSKMFTYADQKRLMGEFLKR